MSPITTARWTLICGVAFVFLYFGIDKFVHPALWVDWMPLWMDGLFGMSVDTWLAVTGVAEIVIAVMVLVPKRILQKIGALLATVHLIAILTQIGWNEIAVRDTGLVCMTIALWYLL